MNFNTYLCENIQKKNEIFNLLPKTSLIAHKMPSVNYKNLNKLTNNILKISINNNYDKAIYQISKLTYNIDTKETLGLKRAINIYISYIEELPKFKYNEKKHGNNISSYQTALDKEIKKIRNHFNKKR